MLLELYNEWLTLLAEYEYLTKPDIPERVQYRQYIVDYVLSKQNLDLDFTEYVNQGIVNPIILPHLQVDFKPIKHLLAPLEERFNSAQKGHIVEAKMFKMLNSFDFSQVKTDEFNIVALLDLSKNKATQLGKVARLRRLVKAKFQIDIMLEIDKQNNTALVKANVQKEYAPMLRNLQLK